MKVAVVTPTIGSDTLKDCLDSVQNQTYEDLVHYIFLDGEQNFSKIMAQGIKTPRKNPVKSIGLEENVGKGWYGHRVYAACSFLVNADIICYLDEDNWFDPEHVQNLVDVIQDGNDWAYSLRKIYTKDGKFLLYDNCESLGKWPVYFDDNIFHVDTSSFAIKRDVAVKVGHTWYAQWGADRQFFHVLKAYFPKFDCTRNHSMCYRLDGNPNSVNQQFFSDGNQVISEKYNDDLPWLKPRLKTGTHIYL